MGAALPELSLDLHHPTYVPKTIGGFLGEISMMGSGSGKLTKLDEYIKKLEEEMKKIDAFKRELPLCMLLIKDAIGLLKEEAMQCSRVQPVMEEFLPVTRNSDDDQNAVRVEKERDVRDKKDWLSSVQLWNSNGITNSNREHKQKSAEMKKGAENDDPTASENSFLECKYRNGGGAFLPFKGILGFPPTSMVVKEKENHQPEIESSPSGLSLLTPEIKSLNAEPPSSYFLNSKNSGSTRGILSSVTTSNHLNLQTSNPTQQSARKQRRCWSPELHRLFVNALQQLGGCHVATPKQIRELMKVEGLTNDEVKSHLQKYRLHTRRIPASASATSGQPVVVLGGIWVPQNQCGNSKSSTSQSGSPQGPLQMSGNGGGISTTGGDSMEDDEDRRSESYSWKGHLCKPSEDEA